MGGRSSRGGTVITQPNHSSETPLYIAPYPQHHRGALHLRHLSHRTTTCCFLVACQPTHALSPNSAFRALFVSHSRTCLHPEELDGAICVSYRERLAVGAPSNARERAIAHVFLSQGETSLPAHSPTHTNREEQAIVIDFHIGVLQATTGVETRAAPPLCPSDASTIRQQATSFFKLDFEQVSV